MSKHGLRKSSDFVEVLHTRQVFNAGAYIHDFRSNDGQRFCDRLRGQPPGKSHRVTRQPDSGFTDYRQLERYAGTAFHLSDLRFDQYDIGLWDGLSQEVQVR